MYLQVAAVIQDQQCEGTQPRFGRSRQRTPMAGHGRACTPVRFSQPRTRRELVNALHRAHALHGLLDGRRDLGAVDGADLLPERV